MTLNGLVAVIMHYFTQYGSLRRQLHQIHNMYCQWQNVAQEVQLFRPFGTVYHQLFTSQQHWDNFDKKLSYRR